MKPLCANDETFLAFWLTKTPVLYATGKGVSQVDVRARHLFGLQSRFNGYQTFNGKHRFFGVQFKSNGFYSIFGIPMHHLKNNLLHGDDVIGDHVRFLEEQLCEAATMEEMVQLADAFFTPVMLRHGIPNGQRQIAAACHIIRQGRYNSIPGIAGYVNMSIRSFEQKFVEQVGITPVAFARIKRFHQAVEMKLKTPEQSWTSIAASCSYFDQMHLIKDFKVFAGATPKAFFQHLPPPPEHFVKEEV